MTVAIKDVVDRLESPAEEYPAFVDLESGEVVSVSLELLRIAEDSEEDEHPPALPQWQRSEWVTACRIASRDSFLRLPSSFEVHECSIMDQFALSVRSRPKREELMNSLHGRGAFRHFKDTLRRQGLEKDWHACKERALRQIAIDFRERHGLAWK